MDEITEIDKEVRRLRERIFELNKRRIDLKKLIKTARQNGPTSPEVLAIPITSLRLNCRVQNMFKHNNIETLGDLAQLHRVDLRRLPNFGEKSLLEVKDLLLTFGLKIKGDN